MLAQWRGIMQCLQRFYFLGTQEQVQNSHGKRAIGVQATEVLLYIPLA